MTALAPETADESALQALRAWVASVTSLEVATEPFEERRPALPYMGIRLTSPGRGEGHDAETYADDDGDGLAVRSGVRRATATLNAYGSGGAGAIETLRLSIASLTHRETLLAAGVVVIRVGQTRDASDWFGDKTETRHLAEVDFRYVVAASDPVDVIESVEATIATE